MATQTIPKNPLPDFSRLQWVSAEARSAWEPRIRSIGEHFAAAERESVEAGIRSAALQSISPEQQGLPELAKRAAKKGLTVAPLECQGRHPHGYAAGAVHQTASGPWDYRVVMTTVGAAGTFVEAWSKNDDEAIGRLLGYPECCRQFFAQTWGKGSVDPTWEMADHGAGAIEANILLRWLGVRYVPHLPCGFRCKDTIELGRKLRELIPRRERHWMDALLSMPMLWSSLHGIGEVVTPIVTLNFRSDVAHELRGISRPGTSYPEAGAHGLRFPYRLPPARRQTWITPWADNGFRSLAAMKQAHRLIDSILPAEPRSVLDLGCGNGLLAKRLAGVGGRAIGIELDEGRAHRAKVNLDEVVQGDLLQQDLERWRSVDLVVLMPGRLIEKHCNGFVSKLRGIGKQLLVYAYGDWLERHGSLEELCHAAGMDGGLSEQALGADGAAGIWEWA